MALTAGQEAPTGGAVAPAETCRDPAEGRERIRLGLRANLAQFALLVGVNGLVGAMVGQERVLVPLLGEGVFGLTSATALGAFLVTFGFAKAVANLAAGSLADRLGRKPVLVIGWLVGLPVPLLLMWSPSWGVVVAANLLLGLNQGLTWSATVVMKIDLAGPERRGLATGLNEFAGYLAVAASASASGALAARYGLRPEPFFLGLAVAGLGLTLSVLTVRETKEHARAEAPTDPSSSLAEVLAQGSYRDTRLAAASRAGLVNNANDAWAWGLLPVLMAREGSSASDIGIVAAIYPAVWSVAQLLAGPLSDRIGRRIPAAAGMWIQALALGWFLLGEGFAARVGAASVLGLGTALAYPTLLASIADVAAPSSRARAIGVYRLWRDSGYVVGALAAGFLSDVFSARAALAGVAIATIAAGTDVWRNLSPEPLGRSGQGRSR